VLSHPRPNLVDEESAAEDCSAGGVYLGLRGQVMHSDKIGPITRAALMTLSL
jgi:hypothetical protein